MRVSRLFSNTQLESSGSLTLDSRNSHYLKNVLRIKEGATLILFDGRGGEYESIVSHVGKREITIDIGVLQNVSRESSLHSHLGLAISRGERMDWALQKATELGVSTITPLLSKRSEFKLKADKLEKKRQHWNSVCISACEQSGRTIIPTIEPPATLQDWSDKLDVESKLFLAPTATQSIAIEDKKTSVALAIGAEGGLDDSEIQLLSDNGFQGICLGPRIMRTETAPLAVLSVLQFHWGDLAQ